MRGLLRIRFVFFSTFILLAAMTQVGKVAKTMISTHGHHATKPAVFIVSDGRSGRLGDNLLTYCKAKYLSYKYNLPLYIAPFEYADKLGLRSEPIIHDHEDRSSHHKIQVNNESDLSQALETIKQPTYFNVHLLTQLNEHAPNNPLVNYERWAWTPSIIQELCIQHPEFGKTLKNMLTPLRVTKTLKLPKDKICVAVHIRTGGGFDKPLLSHQYYDTQSHPIEYKQFVLHQDSHDLQKALLENIPTIDKETKTGEFADEIWPDRFPPEQFYVDQIKKLSEFLNNQNIYVYIFTDDANHKALTKRIKQMVNKKNITFSCKNSHNAHNVDVLEDMTNMAQFDCLIRPGSHYSYMAQLMGNHNIVVYPLKEKWITSKTLLVDRVGITIRRDLPNSHFLEKIEKIHYGKSNTNDTDTVTIAILAKNVAYQLPLYLSCIENQTWPKNKTNLYIRTNNNSDKTADILRTWLERVKGQYAAVHLDDSDVSTDTQGGVHNWTAERLKLIGRLRQASLDWAKEHNSHYFIADCDSFIKPTTVENAIQANLPIVAPLVTLAESPLCPIGYLNANFRASMEDVIKGGYFATPDYEELASRKRKELAPVPLVEEVYFIRNDVIDQMKYTDETDRNEFIIFAENARNKNIQQYIDTRELYGYKTYTSTKEQFDAIKELKNLTRSP